MMLTRRDLDIIDFLEEFKIASTSTLKELFFPSLSSCQKRLKTLYEYKRLQRARLTMNHDYIYYVKKPSGYMHSLLVTEFYQKLKSCSTIKNFIIEKELGKIRPDAIFVCERKGKQILGLLEVEISHKGFDFDKYNKFYDTGVYKNYFPVMPTVYVVSKQLKVPTNTNVKYVTIKTDMSNFEL